VAKHAGVSLYIRVRRDFPQVEIIMAESRLQ
jgi:hypothetical protein